MKNIEKYVKSSLKKKITVNRALIILFMITVLTPKSWTNLI